MSRPSLKIPTAAISKSTKRARCSSAGNRPSPSSVATQMAAAPSVSGELVPADSSARAESFRMYAPWRERCARTPICGHGSANLKSGRQETGHAAGGQPRDRQYLCRWRSWHGRAAGALNNSPQCPLVALSGRSDPPANVRYWSNSGHRACAQPLQGAVWFLCISHAWRGLFRSSSSLR